VNDMFDHDIGEVRADRGAAALESMDSPQVSARIATSSARQCFHCGEVCPDSRFGKDAKIFCCQGCLVVHDLLTENGLDHFYTLNSTPGIRVSRGTDSSQWTFLDEAAVQSRLLDFTDGKQSRITFHIPAIHCVACVWLLENLFRLDRRIGRSQVNFTRREVSIGFAAQELKLSELVALLVSIGYEPSLTLGTLDPQAASPIRKRHWLQIGIAGFAFGNIMLFSLPQYFGLDGFNGPAFRSVFNWLSLALALPVVVYSAGDYWRSATLSLRQRVLTLDVPIALGLVAIYSWSLFEIISRTGEGYCDSLTGLIFFLLCGRAFQQKTHERLAFDRDYKSFFPLCATRIRGDHDHDSTGEERVSLSKLEIGDHILVRNGEIIPADARLISGPAFIDYSFVTGESEPLAKKSGDYLYAGGQQVGAAIEVEISKEVSQSYLTSLWNHEAFQKNRDNVQNTITNRYSRRFTLLVIGMAITTAAFWIVQGDPARGLKAFTSVLIVACPCALALAAPFTLGTAQRWLTGTNVFLRNALVLERMAQVDTIVFDKTGTLTVAGANTVSFHESFDGCDSSASSLARDEARWIFSLARQSTHPHSARITESFGETSAPAPVESYHEIPGCGIEGEVQGHQIRLGSRAWLESRGVCCAREVFPEQSSSSQDATIGSRVHVAIDGRERGVFTVCNSLRPETDHLISRLGERYELALLSGDNARERQRFGSLFGNDGRLNFDQSPMDKLEFIRALQASGRVVMMVGDGLNDAGALRQSDVGVAVVEKIGAFSPASDVIIDAVQVSKLHGILTLSRRAARIVRFSFGISAAYNLIGVSIAATGLLSPLVCAVLMPLSSASVVLFACAMTAWSARSVAQVSKPARVDFRSSSNRLATAGSETRDTTDLETCATTEVVQ
jgi:Cu+-exporting ATPase